MDGILFLHDLAGKALMEANAEISRLTSENMELKDKLNTKETSD